MFESGEYKRVEKILDKKTPSYRKAYSDRMAWLMAYMSELAYLVSARKPRNSVNLNGECRLLSGEDSSYLVELRSY